MITAISDWASRHYYLIAERAYVLHAEGRYHEALLLFDGLLAINPLDSYCREAISALHLALGQWEETVHASSLVLEADSLNKNALARRCEAHIQLDRLSDAERDLQLLRQSGALAHARRMQSRLSTAKQKGGAANHASSAARAAITG